MFRFVTTYLLITLVVICPYSCLGESVTGKDAAREACDCCCDARSDTSNETSPNAPEQRDVDCFCQGAIFDSTRPMDDDLAVSAAITWGIAAPLSLPPSSLASVSFESPHPFPPFCSGRDVCALICALRL